jgi:hypothetical protein
MLRTHQNLKVSLQPYYYYYYYYYFVLFLVMEHQWNETDRGIPKYSG